MKTQHTAGPWKMKPNAAHGDVGAYDIVPASGLAVSLVLDEGNARLIASAPELLEALENLIMFPLGQFQVEAALNAVRKARGEL
jgi:hypothetical protein